MKPAFPTDLQNTIQSRGVVAVLVIDEIKHAVPVARALLRGGIASMELTLRTPAALECIRAIRQEVPEMLAGVGTVIEPRQVDEVVRAGGAFAVAPGCNPRVIAAAVAAGLPFAPGIATATDIESALESGCRLLKFFPAETSGGLRHLDSIAAPYAHLKLRYIPLGGLNANNMRVYLENRHVAALGGSWLASRDLIAAERWDDIAANAHAAADAVKSVRTVATAGSK